MLTTLKFRKGDIAYTLSRNYPRKVMLGRVVGVVFSRTEGFIYDVELLFWKASNAFVCRINEEELMTLEEATAWRLIHAF